MEKHVGQDISEVAAAHAEAAAEQPGGDEDTDDPAPPTQVMQKYHNAMNQIMECNQTKENEDIAKHSRGSRLVAVSALRWDLNMEHGQCRTRRPHRVSQIKKQMQANRPRVPQAVLVWDAGRMLGASAGA